MKQAILFKDGVEVKRALYPRKDMAAVPNIEAGYEWKLIVKDPFPNVDRRLYNIQVVETSTETPHPDHPYLKQFTITYTTSMKSQEDLIEEVKKIEDEKNEAILGVRNQAKYLWVAIASALKELRGGSPTALENTVRDRVIAKAVNIVNNHLESEDKISKIQTLDTFDLDTNWHITE